MKPHCCKELIIIFNKAFQARESTVLVSGGEEPLYRPADEDSIFHQIIFTRDYFASALHEIAHWCIAGKKRREIMDYGYWYYPDGRDQKQQDLFERVEVKPQALELIFSETIGASFQVSVDNLSGTPMSDTSHFEKKVKQQAQYYRDQGLPERAEIFRAELVSFYKL
jgi:elongation factor P hydroxylase